MYTQFQLCFASITAVVNSASVVTVGLVASSLFMYDLWVPPFAHALALIVPSCFCVRKIRLFLVFSFSSLVRSDIMMGLNTSSLLCSCDNSLLMASFPFLPYFKIPFLKLYVLVLHTPVRLLSFAFESWFCRNRDIICASFLSYYFISISVFLFLIS